MAADIAITPRGPFSWELATDMLGTFPPTAHHGAGPVVRIAFPLDGGFQPVAAKLWWEDGTLYGQVAGTSHVEQVQDQVTRIFSLDVDGTGYPAVGERDPFIGRLMELRPGQRPVLFTSPYECAAWAVISQRINRLQAARIKDRLIDERGERIEVGGGTARCFPPPDRLLDLEEVPGLAAAKVARLRGVASAALGGMLDADRLKEMGEAAAVKYLRLVPGIGEFWAQGVYSRACSAPDAFPGEPATLAALAAARGEPEPPSGQELEEITDRWRPYRMWVSVLLRLAAGRGLLETR
ncbi:MAG TPA: DNA-3-methyladenine glycosylase 2 family protein [Candidatus Dormibacteraeota bacterium]